MADRTADAPREQPASIGNMKIKGRLVAGFGAIILVLVAVVMVTVDRVAEIEERIQRVDVLWAPAASASNGIARNVDAGMAAFYGRALTGEQALAEKRAHIWEEIGQQRAALERLAKNGYGPLAPDRVRELGSLLDALQLAQQAAFDAVEKGRPVPAGTAQAAERVQAFLLGELQSDGSRSGGMNGDVEKQLASDLEASQKSVQNLTLVLWTALLVGMNLSIVIVWLTAGTIAKPVIELAAAARRLAAGESGVEIPATGKSDEIGDLARAMQALASSAGSRRR